ncbi:MAG: ATP synthase F1 subunit delta [Bacteroidales bacterium]|nr:ATP synthase F1 subunit delta [Bacteroidales bacterium]
MKNPKVASRYAKALFDFAAENDHVDAVKDDLRQIIQVLKENQELQIVLNSPVIVPSKKYAIFSEVFSGKLSETSFNFLGVIIKKKREPAIATICEEYIKLYNIAHNIKVATLTTAQPLSTELAEKIKGILEEKTQSTVEIKQVVDPEIIGGILIKFDDYFIDASVISKINKLRQEFAHNIYQVNY